MLKKTARKLQRKRRIRAKVSGTSVMPRLSVFKSNTSLFVQLIDDEKGTTLASLKGPKKDADKIGEEIAKKAVTKKIKKAVFDRGGFKYHGVIKKVADSARKGGLEF